MQIIFISAYDMYETELGKPCAQLNQFYCATFYIRPQLRVVDSAYFKQTQSSRTPLRIP